MGTWADYLISEVQYDKDETHIVNVKEHADLGDRVGVSAITSRQTVVTRLDEGMTYMTITKSPKEGWDKGAEVRVTKIQGTKYLKTAADNTKKDNLGSLPRFNDSPRNPTP